MYWFEGHIICLKCRAELLPRMRRRPQHVGTKGMICNCNQSSRSVRLSPSITVTICPWWALVSLVMIGPEVVV